MSNLQYSVVRFGTEYYTADQLSDFPDWHRFMAATSDNGRPLSEAIEDLIDPRVPVRVYLTGIEPMTDEALAKIGEMANSLGQAHWFSRGIAKLHSMGKGRAYFEALNCREAIMFIEEDTWNFTEKELRENERKRKN